MPNEPSRWQTFKPFAFLVIVIALCFSPCLISSFVYWDDDGHIFDNSLVTSNSPSSLNEIFQSTVNKTYIPLTIFSFNIEHRLFGLNPVAFHLDNIILHILVCLLIYRLVVRMGFHPNAGLLTALLFGIHPMHVEPVAWATARKDVLYSLFYVLAIDRYWMFLSDGKKRSYSISLMFALLSILAKPMALSLPLILGLVEWYKNKKLTARSCFMLVPFFAVAASIAWITYQLNSRVPTVEAGHSLLLWAWTATFYIKKFLTPFVLIPLYQVPQPISLLNPSYLSAVAVLIALPASMIIWRKNRLWIFACLFYILSTFFLWRFDAAVDVTIVGDRFMYLPSLGFCLFLADALIKLPKLKWLTIGLILFCIVKTSAQCRIWQDDLTLWDYVIGKKQDVFIAYNSRAVARVKRNEKLSAFEDFNKALALNPKYPKGYFNRGKLFADMGDQQKALESFTKAIDLNPNDFKYFSERGIAFSKSNELENALEDFNKAVALKPTDAGSFNNRGLVYKKMGNLTAAVEDFTKALALDPSLKYAYFNRGIVWQDLKNYNKALIDLEQAKALGFPIEASRITELQKLLQETGTPANQ